MASLLKDRLLRLSEINDNIINAVIHKIRFLLSELTSLVSDRYPAWAYWIINEQFTSLIGTALFWTKVYHGTSPGEELSMLHISKHKGFIAYVLLQASRGYIEKLIKSAYQRLTELSYLKDSKWSLLLSVIDKAIPSKETINDVHMLGFLLSRKSNLNVFEQLLNVSYSICSNKQPKDESSSIAFKAISSVIAIKLLAKLINTLSFILLTTAKINSSKPDETQKNRIMRLRQAHKGNRCLLCLDNYKNVSSTICGHLFCWRCIIAHLEDNASCPQCRQACLPSQVIFLQNY